MAESNNNTGYYEEEGASIQPNFSIHDLMRMILDNWYWFLLSVVVCLGCATLYIMRTPKVYNRTATILVKDSRKGGSADLTAFADMAGFSTVRNVDNEIYMLQSRRLMDGVVRKLNLSVNYTVKEGLRMRNLYKQSPVEVEFVNSNERDQFRFDLTPLEGDKAELSEFHYVDPATREIVEVSQTIEAPYGDTIATPIGQIILHPAYSIVDDSYVGRKVSVSKTTVGRAVDKFRNAVNSSVVNKQSSIVTLSMNDDVPQRAEDVLNALITIYNEDAVMDRQAVTRTTAEFITDRLSVIGKELGSVDDDIEKFKQRNKMYDVASEATRSITEGSQFKVASIDIENNVQMARYIRNYLLDNDKRSALIPASASIGNAGISQQINAYNEGVLRRDKLASEGSSNNPIVQNLDNVLTSTRRAIVSSLDSHISSLELQLKNMRKEEDRANSRLMSASTHEKEILSIARQQKVKEELYLYLLQKREENELAQVIVEPSARIVDLAYGAAQPIYPRTMIIMLAAIIIGFAIPFGLFYLMRMLDTTIRSRKDIEDRTSIPFLGDIPHADGAMRRSIVVRENGRDPVSEAFRIMRTNMNFMAVKAEELKVIMLTSSNPHAGKTFVSLNLAMTLALTGKRVLLIDVDLRRRSLSKAMGHGKNTAGVSAYLSGNVSELKEVIHNSRYNENLDLIYAGAMPPNPAEMLLSERFEQMIARLRKEYDYILLDSVPALQVADAVITDRVCDLAIYVVREGVLDRRQLPDIERFYRDGKFHNMCIVLNDSSAQQKSHGYGYGYGYGYGIPDEETYSQKENPQGRGLAARLAKIFKRQ